MSRRSDRQYRDDLRSLATLAYNMERARERDEPEIRCDACGEPRWWTGYDERCPDCRAKEESADA